MSKKQSNLEQIKASLKEKANRQKKPFPVRGKGLSGTISN